MVESFFVVELSIESSVIIDDLVHRLYALVSPLPLPRSSVPLRLSCAWHPRRCILTCLLTALCAVVCRSNELKRAKARTSRSRIIAPPPDVSEIVELVSGRLQRGEPCARPPQPARNCARPHRLSLDLRRASAERRAQLEHETIWSPSLAGRRPPGGPLGRSPRDDLSRWFEERRRQQQRKWAGRARWWRALLQCALENRPCARCRPSPMLPGVVGWVGVSSVMS